MNTYLLIFLIMVLGYAVGRIEIKGLSLGTSGVLLVALIFGHFGFEVPSVIRTLGLICFVSSVGIIAGPVFFRNFKKGALQYILLGFLTILIGAVVCAASAKVFDLPVALSVGMMNDALTSTPGLATVLEAIGDAVCLVGVAVDASVGIGVQFWDALGHARLFRHHVYRGAARCPRHSVIREARDHHRHLFRCADSSREKSRDHLHPPRQHGNDLSGEGVRRHHLRYRSHGRGESAGTDSRGHLRRPLCLHHRLRQHPAPPWLRS